MALRVGVRVGISFSHRVRIKASAATMPLAESATLRDGVRVGVGVRVAAPRVIGSE